MKKLHHRHLLVRDNFMLWLGIFTAIMVILIINVAYLSLKHDKSKPSPAPVNSSLILSSLQTDQTKAYTLTVRNVTENSTPDPAFTIDTADTMLIMDISITNTSGTKQDLVPVNQLYVRDREGDTFSMHPSVLLKNPLAAASLAPGQTVVGQISFDVPKRLANPLVYFDFGWDNLAPTVIDVLR